LAPNLLWKIFGWLASFTNSAGIWLSYKTIGGGVAHAKIRRGRRATATRESIIETPLSFMKKIQRICTYHALTIFLILHRNNLTSKQLELQNLVQSSI